MHHPTAFWVLALFTLYLVYTIMPHKQNVHRSGINYGWFITVLEPIRFLYEEASIVYGSETPQYSELGIETQRDNLISRIQIIIDDCKCPGCLRELVWFLHHYSVELALISKMYSQNKDKDFDDGLYECAKRLVNKVLELEEHSPDVVCLIDVSGHDSDPAGFTLDGAWPAGEEFEARWPFNRFSNLPMSWRLRSLNSDANSVLESPAVQTQKSNAESFVNIDTPGSN